MKYALLHPHYCLRGWIGVPYAVVCDGDVFPLNRDEFNAMMFCDGQTDLDSISSQKLHESFSSLEERGFIFMCDSKGELAPNQYYKHYDNRFIKHFYWSITGRCNFKCRHCYINAPDAYMGELTHNEAVRIINQIADCGVYHLLLSGGEPFVRTDFWELVDYALQKGITIDQVYTNGWLLTDTVLDEFENRNIKPEFSISYDGKGWHDWMRGIKGAEQAALNAIFRCSERGFSTNVEMCIHRGNIKVIRDSVNLLAKTGTSSIKTSEVSATNLWKQKSDGNDLSTEEYINAILEYVPYFFEDGMPIDILFGGVVRLYKNSTDYWLVAEFDDGLETCLDRHICGAVRSSCYIAPDGRLLPCMPIAAVPDQSIFPNAKEICLQTALKDSFFMEFADRRVKDLLSVCKTCRECPYHLKCGGGCRACAVLGGEHNLMGPDPTRCLMWKGGYVQKVHNVCNCAIEKFCNVK